MPLTTSQKNKINVALAATIAVIIGAGGNGIFKEGRTQNQINNAVDSIVAISLDTMLAQEKMVYTPPITDNLATCENDSNVAAKTFTRKRYTDTLGHFVWDTITRPAHPALKGFSDENGVCDYSISAIMKKGLRYRILFVEEDSVIGGIRIKPKRNNWIGNIRPTAFLYEGTK